MQTQRNEEAYWGTGENIQFRYVE